MNHYGGDPRTYDEQMADAYRTCYVNLWPLPQEVVNWYERKDREFAAEHQGRSVREEYGLVGVPSPWYYHNLGENLKGESQWLNSEESVGPLDTSTRGQGEETTIPQSRPGAADTADSLPEVRVRVSNATERPISVRVSFKNWELR